MLGADFTDNHIPGHGFKVIHVLSTDSKDNYMLGADSKDNHIPGPDSKDNYNRLTKMTSAQISKAHTI